MIGTRYCEELIVLSIEKEIEANSVRRNSTRSTADGMKTKTRIQTEATT